MVAQTRSSPERRALPPMPQVRLPEAQYARLARHAERDSDPHAHEAAKVGQYITLALDPHLSWEGKVKYFHHALLRHCHPPPFPDEDIWMFYHQLADFVRQHAGEEALRLACVEDDQYATRLGLGQERRKIEEDAEAFFVRFIPPGDECPEWFNQDDFAQLKMIRDQWI